jgi:beta-galactosidase
VENKYGYYGEDKVYLRHLVGKAREHLGQEVLLYTTDGANEAVVRRGTLEGGRREPGTRAAASGCAALSLGAAFARPASRAGSPGQRGA